MGPNDEPDTEKLIQAITEIIIQAVDPKQVILFGFQARGTPEKNPI